LPLTVFAIRYAIMIIEDTSSDPFGSDVVKDVVKAARAYCR